MLKDNLYVQKYLLNKNKSIINNFSLLLLLYLLKYYYNFINKIIFIVIRT